MKQILIFLISFCAFAHEVEVKVINTSAPVSVKEKQKMEKKLSQKVNGKKPVKEK